MPLRMLKASVAFLCSRGMESILVFPYRVGSALLVREVRQPQPQIWRTSNGTEPTLFLSNHADER